MRVRARLVYVVQVGTCACSHSPTCKGRTVVLRRLGRRRLERLLEEANCRYAELSIERRLDRVRPGGWR